MADLNQAIKAYQEAIELTPLSSPDYPRRLFLLGLVLMSRYLLTEHPDDQDQLLATTSLEKACQLGLTGDASTALAAAKIWGRLALEQHAWSEAARAFGYGLEASEKLVQLQRLRPSKEVWLKEMQGLHTAAAYALAKSGDLPPVVMAFEQGQARLLTQALERDQADLADVQRRAPASYQRYQALVSRLHQLESPDASDAGILPPGQTLPEVIRQTRSDLDAVVEVIRQVPGYQEFRRSPTCDQLFQTPGDVPFVYLAAPTVGGVALIVSPAQPAEPTQRPDPTRVPAAPPAITVLWHDALTTEALLERAAGVTDQDTLKAYLESRSRVGGVKQERATGQDALGGYLGAYFDWLEQPDEATEHAWHASLEEPTRWLWDVLMGPLVEQLSTCGFAQAILIPQGFLSLLPLHAAWTEDRTCPTGRRYALDHVLFHYAPHAHAVVKARPRASEPVSATLLAVDEPWPVQATPLPHAASEVEAAASHFEAVTLLEKEPATKEAVVQALGSVPSPAVWHLSCHGAANWADPLESGVRLAHDTWLTLRDLLALRLSGSRLAMLSACESGMVGLQLPDEVVSLPTGLLQAGVAGVIASLWSVSDVSTMLLQVHFYDLWRTHHLEPGAALRQAQRWVRDTTNKEKADSFKRLLLAPETRTLSASFAESLTRAMMLRHPAQRAFAHPYCWAAFQLTGV